MLLGRGDNPDSSPEPKENDELPNLEPIKLKFPIFA